MTTKLQEKLIVLVPISTQSCAKFCQNVSRLLLISILIFNIDFYIIEHDL